MSFWNKVISTPLPTSNKCAQPMPRINANVVVVTQQATVIFQTFPSCPPACKLDTPTTIELKIRGINSILSKPMKMLLIMPKPYKLLVKKLLCGKTLSRKPKAIPRMAAIKIWVFKLISAVILSFKVTSLWHILYVKIEFFLFKK